MLIETSAHRREAHAANLRRAMRYRCRASLHGAINGIPMAQEEAGRK